MISIGNQELDKVYIGSQEMDKVYIGSTLVFEKTVSPPKDIWFDGRAYINRGSITSDIMFSGNWRLHGSTTGIVTPKAGDTVHADLYMRDMPENWYATSIKVMFGSHEVTVSKISGTNDWEGHDTFTISSSIGKPYIKQNYSVMFDASGYLYCSDYYD